MPRRAGKCLVARRLDDRRGKGAVMTRLALASTGARQQRARVSWSILNSLPAALRPGSGRNASGAARRPKALPGGIEAKKIGG